MTVRKRIALPLIVAISFAIVLIAVNAQKANAMGSRDPAGSVTMPASKVLDIQENKEKKINFGTTLDYKSYYYFRIKPTKTGYITFRNDFSSGYDVVLCNGSKTYISSENPEYGDILAWGSQYAYQTWVSYGVKKGQTYMIRVKGGSPYCTEYGQPYIGSVKYTTTAVKAAKYGKSKKKAKKIKHGKKIRGIIQAGSTKSQWYKIKINKKKMKVILEGKYNCGMLIAEVKYKSYGHWWSQRAWAMRSNDCVTGFTTIKQYKKIGQCYIRVFPDKKSSGAYTLRVK